MLPAWIDKFYGQEFEGQDKDSRESKVIMVMLRPPGKPQKIAERVMKGKGIKVPKPSSMEKMPPTTPYLQH
jgi:hypothetical protein